MTQKYYDEHGNEVNIDEVKPRQKGGCLKMALAIIGVIVLMVIIGVAFTDVDTESDELETSELATVEEVEAEEEKTLEESEEETTNSGSRSNPVALGETITQDIEFLSEESSHSGNRSITLSNVSRGEEVYNYLMEANQFNERAPEGMEWVMLDVEYTLNEADTEDEAVYVTPDFSVVASDGSEISQSEAYATLDSGEEFGYVELYSGGQASGKYAFFAPIGDEVLLKFDDWIAPSIFFSLN